MLHPNGQMAPRRADAVLATCGALALALLAWGLAVGSVMPCIVAGVVAANVIVMFDRRFMDEMYTDSNGHTAPRYDFDLKEGVGLLASGGTEDPTVTAGGLTNTFTGARGELNWSDVWN